MFSKNFYLGLDISDLSVKAVQFKIAGNNSEVVSYGSIELTPGIVQSGEINSQKELSDSIKKLFAEIKGVKIKSKYVGCSLPEEKSFVRLVSLPSMSDKELKEAIKWAAETEIPLRIDELCLGWQVIGKPEDTGDNSKEHIDVLLTASPKEIVYSYIGLLKELGLTPIFMGIESNLAVQSLINLDNHKNQSKHIYKPKEIFSFGLSSKITTKKKNNKPRGRIIIKPINNDWKSSTLIVDIGAHRTNFIIFNGQTVCFTSTIEFGSNGLNEVLSKVFKIDMKKAEKIKQESGLDREEKQGEIFDALIPPITSLTEEISKVLDYYREHHDHGAEQLNISKIIICGGGALLKGLIPHLQKALDTEVVLGNPWINFNNIDLTKKNRLPIIPKEISLAYSTVLGICLSIKNEYAKLWV